LLFSICTYVLLPSAAALFLPLNLLLYTNYLWVQMIDYWANNNVLKIWNLVVVPSKYTTIPGTITLLFYNIQFILRWKQLWDCFCSKDIIILYTIHIRCRQFWNILVMLAVTLFYLMHDTYLVQTSSEIC
jgi:hypothetical protein